MTDTQHHTRIFNKIRLQLVICLGMMIDASRKGLSRGERLLVTSTYQNCIIEDYIRYDYGF